MNGYLSMGTLSTIGISDFAQSQLSDIVYVEFKVEVGDEVKKESIVSYPRFGESHRRCKPASLRQGH